MAKFSRFVSRTKDLVTLGSGTVIGSLISGIFWLFMANELGVESYGSISYLIAIINISYVISYVGIGNTITVYTSKEEKIQSSFYTVGLISGGLASLILFFIFTDIGMSIFPIGSIIFGAIIAEALGQKKFQNYAKYIISQRILQVVFSFGLYLLIGDEGIILGYGLSYLLFTPKYYSSLKNSKFDFKIVKKRFKFMMDAYAMNLSRSLSLWLDKLLIVPLLGFVSLGNYQLGFQILLMLSIVPSTVSNYVLTHHASGTENKKLKIITVLISFGFAVITILLSPEVVPKLFPKYTNAVDITQVMIISIIPITINLMYNAKFLGIEKSRLVLYGSVIFITIQVMLIIILGESMGIIGIAWSLVIAYSMQSVFLISIEKIKK